MDNDISMLLTAIIEAFHQTPPNQDAKEVIQTMLRSNPLHFFQLLIPIINNQSNPPYLISLALLLSDEILKFSSESTLDFFSYDSLMDFIKNLFSFFSNNNELIRNSATKSCANFYIYLYSNIISETNENYLFQISNSQSLFLNIFHSSSNLILLETTLQCFEYISEDMDFSFDSTNSFFNSLLNLLFSSESPLKIKNLCVQIIENFHNFFSEIITQEFILHLSELLVQIQESSFYLASFPLLSSLILLPQSVPLFQSFYPACIQFIS